MKDSSVSDIDMRFWQKRLKVLRRDFSELVVGHEVLLETLILSLLTEGHCLLIGYPGMGKSLALRTLCSLLHLQAEFVMHQADFVGRNLLLVEELDKANPLFRRELLTAMQEKQCVYQGQTYYMARPFVVLATVNPGGDGVRDGLTQAERDRFLFSLPVPWLTLDQELEVLRQNRKRAPATIRPEPVFSTQDLLEIQRSVRSLPVESAVEQRILAILGASRGQGEPVKTNEVPILSENPQQLGLSRLRGTGRLDTDLIVETPLPQVPANLSTRSALYLQIATQAHAFYCGRQLAILSDLLAVESRVLSHRQGTRLRQ